MVTVKSRIWRVSIHAPHEGERPDNFAAYRCGAGFNPRSPRGGATFILCQAFCLTKLFQSTLPTRGSDQTTAYRLFRHKSFNPRSPRGGATFESIRTACKNKVSIHAPHEGERLHHTAPVQGRKRFNPRSPRGGATFFDNSAYRARVVSIHAPHEGERPSIPMMAML